MCNDAPIGKVDLDEVCLRLLPHWPPIKRDGATVEFVTVGDNWLRLLTAPVRLLVSWRQFSL